MSAIKIHSELSNGFCLRIPLSSDGNFFVSHNDPINVDKTASRMAINKDIPKAFNPTSKARPRIKLTKTEMIILSTP